MPSKSPRQTRTMRAAAHDPDFARKMGIPKKVAEEFVEADQAKRGPTSKKAPRRRRGK